MTIEPRLPDYRLFARAPELYPAVILSAVQELARTKPLGEKLQAALLRRVFAISEKAVRHARNSQEPRQMSASA